MTADKRKERQDADLGDHYNELLARKLLFDVDIDNDYREEKAGNSLLMMIGLTHLAGFREPLLCTLQV